MLYLHVPYDEKDIAKKLGAVWKPERKQWAVISRNDYYKFSRWFIDTDEPYIPESIMILVDHFYLIEGVQKCWRCKKDTRVIGIGIGPHIVLDAYDYCYEDDDGDFVLSPELTPPVPEIVNEEIHIAENIEPWPPGLLEYLKREYNYHYGFSKTLNGKCYANHCQSCNALQGNFFLFHEVNTPFGIDSPKAAEKLKIYKVDLPYDIVTLTEPGWGSEDWMIYEYGQKLQLNEPVM